MVLSAALELDKNDYQKLFDSFEINILSIGTDGIDGPTDAAGAVANNDLIQNARQQGLEDPQSYLAENNSYEFFSVINGGSNLIKMGHTGTNVMDIHVLTMSVKN